MHTALIAFCGIDGSGKSTVLAAVREQLARRFADISFEICKSANMQVRSLIERHLPVPADETFCEGIEVTWSALSSALDYVQFCDEHVLSRLSCGGRSVLLLDRYVDCYVAYAGAVTPPCESLVSALVGRLPRPDVLFHVVTPPMVAWERILSRPPGPGPRESPRILERLASAYKRRFADHPDVVTLDNGRTLDEPVAAAVDHLSAWLDGRMA